MLVPRAMVALPPVVARATPAIPIVVREVATDVVTAVATAVAATAMVAARQAILAKACRAECALLKCRRWDVPRIAMAVVVVRAMRAPTDAIDC